MMSTVETLFTVALVAAGAVFYLAGTVGILRFPDPISRLHALSKADNLGLGLIAVGLLPLAGGWQDVARLVGLWFAVQLSSAVVAQLLSRAARDESR
jgi:multicomponent Na+:H+ antiporter subunit G